MILTLSLATFLQVATPLLIKKNTMKEKRNNIDRIITEWFWRCVIVSGIVCMLYCMMSCKGTAQIVEVEKVTVRSDTTYIERLQRDSLYLHDSIYVKEAVKGDTVRVEVERWHTRYIERIARDTIYKHSTDSVRVPVVTEKIVEKKVERNLSWWEQTRIYGFYLLLIVIVAIYRKQIWSLLKKFILRVHP